MTQIAASQTGQNPQLTPGKAPKSPQPPAEAVAHPQVEVLSEDQVALQSAAVRHSEHKPQVPDTRVQLQPAQPTQPQALSPREIQQRLSTPASLKRVEQILAQAPELAQRLEQKPGGKAVVALLKQAAVRSLSKTEVTQLQQFLVKEMGQSIGYRGHTTGIDGQYGPRTHRALVAALTAEPASAAKPAPTSQAPATQPPAPKPERAPAPASTPLLTQVQQQAGNLQALAQLSSQFPPEALQKLTPALRQSLTQAAARPLTGGEARNLQTQLVQAGQNLSYPGHNTGIDGQFGARSRQALVNVLSQALDPQFQAKAPPAAPSPRYDRMLSDQLLDVTVAVGYDEGTVQFAGAHRSAEAEVLQKLASRGFVRNDQRALELLKGAGREVNASYSALYLKEDIDTHNGQPVHAIVRLVRSGDGSRGAENRQAALEGMNQSDAFLYGGHARFGQGLDFDRNFTVTIDWEGVPQAPAQGRVSYTDTTQLKNLLGGSDAKALQRFKELQSQGKVQLSGSNAGNIRMNENQLHRGEFGSQLMHQALQGERNPLSEEIQGDNYRLWLFNGCRTQDYQQPIRQQARQNSALNEQNLDLVLTQQSLYWHNISDSLMGFLDGVMARDNSQQLLGRLQNANPEHTGSTHLAQGFGDNP